MGEAFPLEQEKDIPHPRQPPRRELFARGGAEGGHAGSAVPLAGREVQAEHESGGVSIRAASGIE